LGEVGLDYKVKIKKSLQHNVFSQVLALAEKYKKPVIVHSRYSYEKTYEMVSAANIKKAVFHWYSGPLDVLEKIIDAGYFISATPALAYSEKHQEAVLKAPLDQILIETDSPVEYQGKLSEPATLIETIAELSKLKKEPVEIIAEKTTKNAKWFFDI
jgi:TatD DNase family protein